MSGSEIAVIVGAGSGLGAALAKTATQAGMSVVVAARDAGRLTEVARSTGAMARPTDGTDAASVEALFSEVERRLGVPSLASTTPAGVSGVRSPTSIPSRCSVSSR